VGHNGTVALSTGVLLRRGLRRRCPVCGQNKLFRRWIHMLDDCPRCGLTFQRVPGQWLGSWFLNICLAQVLVIGIVLGGAIAAYPNPPLLLLGLVGGVVTIAFPIWFFPYSRTLWVAIDLAMRPLEFEEGVDPHWELETDAAQLARERAARPATPSASDPGADLPPAAGTDRPDGSASSVDRPTDRP
jgi:uncharacterized protein (DUF983 family)